MARIAGVDLPRTKRIEIGLTYIYGIGRKRSNDVLSAAGVSPALLETLVERIGALNRQGVTILVIEHNLDVVMELCRSVVVMAGGALLAAGEPGTVRSDPRVIDAYLGGAPL